MNPPDQPQGEPRGKSPTIEPPIAKPTPIERVGIGLWNWVIPGTILILMFVIALFASAEILHRWRVLEGKAEADAFFHKRLAELRADAEHADTRLDVLDKRANLVSLGFREVVRKAAPKVVSVFHYREPPKKDLDKRAEKLLTYDADNERRYVHVTSGSGLIVKPGVILTNNHVVRGAQRLRIAFASGQSIGVDMNAVVVDAITDLAVIKLPENVSARIKEESSNVADFADSDKDVQVGDWALAMGTPFGLRQTVTQGIISAKGRLLPMLDLVELLQTDAAMNPGNSGGPLFDQLGRVVGVNVMIVSDNGVNQGIGFAIPANTAKKIAEQLATTGEVPRGYLGIAMDELPPAEAKKRKIDDGGILVKAVLKGQAAANADLRVGDVILRINKDAISRIDPMRHFRQLVVDLDPGREITLEVLRGEERQTLNLTVGRRPASLQ